MTFLQLLPEGFALPPLPYLLVLGLGLVAVGVGVTRREPAFDRRHVLAAIPWIVTGSSVHALYVVDALPRVLRPLAGTPAVYATVTVVAGAIWLGSDAVDDAAGTTSARVLGVTGLVAVVVASGAGIGVGLARGTLSPVWPAIALIASLIVGAAAWVTLRQLVPRVEAAGTVGALAVVSHAVDGVSTAVGIDVLGFGERTPLSRLIIEFAAELPTASVLGTGWLFVVVKLLVAGGVVVLLADLMEDDPREGSLLLGFVAAVGLGPGAHNLLLFTIA